MPPSTVVAERRRSRLVAPSIIPPSVARRKKEENCPPNTPKRPLRLATPPRQPLDDAPFRKRYRVVFQPLNVLRVRRPPLLCDLRTRRRIATFLPRPLRTGFSALASTRPSVFCASFKNWAAFLLAAVPKKRADVSPELDAQFASRVRRVAPLPSQRRAADFILRSRLPAE